MDNAVSDNVKEAKDPKRKGSTEESGELVKKMRPDVYNAECFPINELDVIPDVLENPPRWINRIIPLKSRSPTVVQNTISDCHVEIKKFAPKTRLDARFVPKTLVCHDYKGGYLEDKYLTGSNTGNLYTFYNWDHIDVFVYFSHHLVTIPPLAWTNAAHRNGVKILGTLITEFGPGAKICEKIFKDEDTMRIFATHLTQIAKLFRFDGWLLNIENGLPNTDMLKKFVAYLTVMSHKENPDSLVIWYDSVIETGELKWQNELNNLNKIYFDSCDGIFLNYVWNEENVKKTVEYAKHRTLDVYVGVDVFGRNTFGGGKFNCFKAAQIIRRHHLSMAIFAPGWTHETLPSEEVLDRAKFFEDFINRDSAFWNSLWPYLYTHPIPQCFRTNFFVGTDQDKYSLFTQQQQLSKIKHPRSTRGLVPDFPEVPTLSNKCNCLQTDFSKTGNLGLLITKASLNTSICFVHRLFTCDIPLEGTVTLYFLAKINEAEPSSLSLSLMTVNKNGTLRQIQCSSSKKEEALIDNMSLREIGPSSDMALINYVMDLYESLILADDLAVFTYQFELAPCTLLEIGCTLDVGRTIRLCAFGIETKF